MKIEEPRFCIIIGAMKCGTSTLFDLLAQHPSIVPSKEKEPGFFSFPHVYKRGFDWYLSLWDHSKCEKVQYSVLLEASTHYTKSPDIPSGAFLMAGHLKDPLFIYIVRDPIQRIESQADYDLMRGRLFSRVKYTDEHLLNVTSYMQQLKPYIEEFGRESILVLNFSDLISEPDNILRKIAVFLNIDPEGFADAMLPHKNKTPVLISKLRQILNWASYHKKPKLFKWFLILFCSPLRFIRLKRSRMSENVKMDVLRSLASDYIDFKEYFGWYPMSKETASVFEHISDIG